MDGEVFFDAAYRETKPQNRSKLEPRGFSRAVTEQNDNGMDLNEYLVKNRPATFFMRVKGEAMINAGIHDGDIVVVDRSLKPVNGKVIIAMLNGEMLIRRFEKTFNKVKLIPETSKLASIDVDPYAEFLVWGVVTYVIHSL